MNWAKEAAEAIIDDDALLAEADAKRRRRNTALTLGALAGVAGIGAGMYANRGAISKAYNDAVADPSKPGVMGSILRGAVHPMTLAGQLANAARSKTIAKLPGIGKALRRLGIDTEVGVKGIRDQLATLGAAKNKGQGWVSPWLTSENEDAAAALRGAVSPGTGGAPDATHVERLQNMLEHYEQNKLDPAGKPISHFQRAVEASPALVKSRWESGDAFKARQLGAALRHVATHTPSDKAPAGETVSPLQAHEGLLREIAVTARPGIDPADVTTHRSVAGGLGQAFERHQAASGRYATPGRVALRSAVPFAIPYAVQGIRNAFGSD